MNAVLDRLLTSGEVTRADGTRAPLQSALSAEEGRALQRLIRAYRPRTTLEVGLAYGVSGLFICEALVEVGGRQHITIDPLQRQWGNLGLEHLKEAGFGALVEHHEAPSYRVLPQLEASGRRVDFALIDGWHTFDYAFVDFFYIDRLLTAGGVLAIDDAWSYRALRKLVRYIALHRRYTPIDTGIAPRRSSPRRRLFDWLVAPLRAVASGRRAGRLLHPSVLTPDAALKLPADDLVAFVKTGEDELGDGTAGTRRWDQHFDF
jgi:predicted O-methyltransferase YrrM